MNFDACQVALRNDDETCRCSIWVLQSITLWTCVLSWEGSRPWNLLDCHCEQRPASRILDRNASANECECKKSQVPTIGRFQCITHTSIESVGILNVLRKNIEKMELQCDFLPVSGSNSSAPCSASMPPWKPLMKTSQWLRRWDAWHQGILYRYFDYFDLFLCGKSDIIDFKHWLTVVFFVQVLSPSDMNECSHTGKGVLMSFVYFLGVSWGVLHPDIFANGGGQKPTEQEFKVPWLHVGTLVIV